MIRDIRSEDIPEIQALHKTMGMDYDLPDLDDPLCIVRKVVTNQDGKIIAVGFCRVIAEAYMVLDPSMNAFEKNAAQTILYREGVDEAWRKGLKELCCWIPDTIEKKFSKRIQNMGFRRGRDGWRTWSLCR